jgi:hypothetical protein
MIPKFILRILACAGLVFPAIAQDAAQPAVQIRAVLHDPMSPTAELFYPDATGHPTPLEFRPKDLTSPLIMRPVEGTLVLRDTATIDPKNPAAGIAATLKLPPDLRRAILIVLPAPDDSKLPYRLLLIDDSEKAFPKGESRVLSLIGVKTAVQAGEHKVPLDPGKISPIPSVRKVNDFQMAQTNFYYQHGEVWIPFTERQLQFTDACRRIFIVHATPGALQPTITTIVDTAMVTQPP